MASRPVAPKPIVLRPDLTISGGGAVTEGTAASFTVTASPAPTSPLTVNLTVADAAGSDFVAAGNEGSKTVTVPTSGTATYTVATKGDSTDEPSGPVTVTVVSGSGYTVGSPSSAAVMVNDDDDAGTPQDKTSDNAAPPKAKPTITPPPQDNGDDTAEPEFMSTRFAFTLAENLVGPAPVLTSGGAPGVVHATGAGVTYTLTGERRGAVPGRSSNGHGNLRRPRHGDGPLRTDGASHRRVRARGRSPGDCRRAQRGCRNAAEPRTADRANPRQHGWRREARSPQ